MVWVSVKVGSERILLLLSCQAISRQQLQNSIPLFRHLLTSSSKHILLLPIWRVLLRGSWCPSGRRSLANGHQWLGNICSDRMCVNGREKLGGRFLPKLRVGTFLHAALSWLRVTDIHHTVEVKKYT